MEALGLNLFNIIVYVILFVLVYVLLDKVLIKRLVGMIEKRQDELKTFAGDQEKLDREAKELETKKANIEKDLAKENNEKLNKIMLDMKKEKEKVLEEARKESSEIISEGRKKLSQEEQKLKAEMESKVELATKKALKEVYKIEKESIDKALINKAIKEIS